MKKWHENSVFLTSRLPTVAIVGRPNVGKSTLFNRLTGRRQAIVDDMPGVTRDRLYGRADWRGKSFAVIDTGGFDPGIKEGIWKEMQGQVKLAIEEADVIIFLLDGAGGATPTDEDVASYLRKAAKAPVFYAVNKIDSAKREGLLADFWRLGAKELYPVSAEHSRGVDDLLDAIYEHLPETPEEEEQPDVIPVAVIGKPNVGKSTLINRILGEPRLLTHDVPGTTRDAVDTLFQHGDKTYRFIDTAGIRRKSKTSHRVEKFSIIKALQAIDRSNVTLLLIDAVEGPTDQDAKVAGYALERGKAAIILLNKWDLMEKETGTFEKMVKVIRENLPHIDYAPVLSVSAKTGQRVDRILEAINIADEQHARRVPTHALNKVFESAVTRHRPPVVKNHTIKLFYASQLGVRPPRFAIVTNRPDDVPVSYQRYLINQMRESLGFDGTPIRLYFRPRKDRHAK